MLTAAPAPAVKPLFMSSPPQSSRPPHTWRARRPLLALACALAFAASLLLAPTRPRDAGAATPLLPRVTRSGRATAQPNPSPTTTPAGTPGARAPYVPDVVLVRYAPATPSHVRATIARAAGAGDPTPIASHTRLLRLSPGSSVATTIARLRRLRGVQWAVPDYIAHAAEGPGFIPNDPGRGHTPGAWQQLQWNFSGTFGVRAPQAWANLAADGARGGGGRGVVVAVLDTGIAYSNRGPFRRSPDFTANQFVAGYDFVAHSPYANDRNGHGTHVAGTIAEATGNNIDLTGLAYGVRLMPVRVLNAEGEGDAATIAQGVRFAVAHHAAIINLSLEFSSFVTAADIPSLLEALRYAHRHGVLVVAAAGNEGHRAIAYPARAPDVVSVGASTEHGCLASYSNDGSRLTLVAPGGGPDADLADDPNCHPEATAGRNIFQVTFIGTNPRRFGIPTDYDGTSMATPHVSATAALIIASRVLGAHPTPAQILARLRATARPLGGPGDRQLYGAGLVDAGAATAPGGPGAVR